MGCGSWEKKRRASAADVGQGYVTVIKGCKQSCTGREIHGSTPSTGKARAVCVRMCTCSARSRRTTAGVPSRGMSAGVTAPQAASPLAVMADRALPSLWGVPQMQPLQPWRTGC